MKKIVPQGESICVKGLWYNQGDVYEEESGEETAILPIEVVKPKTKHEKKDEVV